MALSAIITLTTVGTDQGPLFDLYSDVDGFTTAFETNVAQLDLESGYTSNLVPDETSIVRVCGQGVKCANCVDITLIYTTTTTTTSAVSTTTTTTTLSGLEEARVSTTTNLTNGCAIDSADVTVSVWVDTQTPGIINLGDIFYNNPTGTAVFEGNGDFYKFQLFPGGGYFGAKISDTGEVLPPISICS